VCDLTFQLPRNWQIDGLPALEGLNAKSQHARADFLRSDLALSFTFANPAITELEMGDRAAAERVLGKAIEGHATIARFLPDVENAGQRKEIGQKLAELHVAIDNVQRRLHD
jgi:hypothetical protein